MTAHAGIVTVLVVDDEEPIRNALRKYLKQQQFEVFAASSADEALQQLRLHKVALMLSDIRMPGTSGVDLVPQALEIEPDLAILMLTAVNDATSAALCMQRGAMDYLTKPIELADLGRAVHRALKRREMQLESRHLNQWLKEEVTTRTIRSLRLPSPVPYPARRSLRREQLRPHRRPPGAAVLLAPAQISIRSGLAWSCS